jgi:hypothetical protein
MKNLEYHRTIVGYHGCDASLVDDVLSGKCPVKPSENVYDWLGRGIYFWEHGPARAKEWAIESSALPKHKIQTPAVLGALIHLGDCFDLLDMEYTKFLRDAFPIIAAAFKTEHPGSDLPKNTGPGLRSRKLDCAIINWAIPMLEDVRGKKFQSVRCVFTEGEPVFDGSCIMLKSHIQIAIRDPSCILGYFRPSEDA